MLKRGQAESFIGGLILFIVFASIGVYGIKLFLGFEKDCFGSLVSNVNEAIKNPGKDVNFDCDFKKPLVVYGKEDKYAFRLTLSYFSYGGSAVVLKPENAECKDKSCVCECGSLVNANIKDSNLPHLLSSIRTYSCKSEKCVGFKQLVLSSCKLQSITSGGSSSIPDVECPFEIGGSLLMDNGPKINLVPTKINFNPSLNVVSILVGDANVLNLEVIESIYNKFLSNIKEVLEKNMPIEVNDGNLLTRLFMQSSKGRAYYETSDFKISFLPLNLNLVFFIHEGKMELVVGIIKNSGPLFSGSLAYNRKLTLTSTDLVSSCYNGQSYPYLLIAPDNIDKEVIKEIAKSYSIKPDSIKILKSMDLEFRADPKNPDKVCLYEKTYQEALTDLTQESGKRGN